MRCRRLDASLTSGYRHWLFHLQHDPPERLVGHDIRGYLEYFYERWTYNRHGLTTEAVDAYVEAFSRPGALRASFDDYRAMEEDVVGVRGFLPSQVHANVANCVVATGPGPADSQPAS